MTKIIIELTDGRVMNAELYEDIAPLSCENFLKLIDAKFFDNLIFHRVIPGFMIQGGGFSDNGMGGLIHKESPFAPIKGEFIANGIKNDLKHVPGVLSMARTQVMDSGTSQFFLCVDDCSFLNGQYAGFGALSDEESLKVAQDISKVPTHNWSYYGDIPDDPVVIKTIKRA